MACSNSKSVSAPLYGQSKIIHSHRSETIAVLAMTNGACNKCEHGASWKHERQFLVPLRLLRFARDRAAMSGIVGILYTDGRPLDRGVLDRMLESIVHRGPDGTGAWAEGPVGLGHQMLHTTPESLKDTLPVVDESGGFVLTADARIDNREELIKDLGFTGLPRKEITDSE